MKKIEAAGYSRWSSITADSKLLNIFLLYTSKLYKWHTLSGAGFVKVSEWCEVMSSIFSMELPWHSLRSKLAKLNSAGLVDYHSTFDDFKLHLKHNPEVGICSNTLQCVTVLLKCRCYPCNSRRYSSRPRRCSWQSTVVSLDAHVTAVCRSGYYQLRQLRPIARSLSVEAAKSLVQAFISTRLDYCNALLHGLPDRLMKRLQSVQNAAARLITGAPRRDHIIPILQQLHWLSVRRRVDFKIAVLVCQCLTGQAPGYLAEDCQCQLVADVSARRLRSADTATCVTHRTSNIFGDRCFGAAGPQLWNSLPINLRQCHSLEQFKRLLKIFLFCAWSHGALWHLPKSAPYINLITCILTICIFLPVTWQRGKILSHVHLSRGNKILLYCVMRHIHSHAK